MLMSNGKKKFIGIALKTFCKEKGFIISYVVSYMIKKIG